MRINRTNLAAGLVAATGATFLAQPAIAQDGESVAFRAEAFAGIARDERPLDGDDGKFSGGLLPSVRLGLGSVAVAQVDVMAADHLGDTVLAGGGHIGFRATEALSVGVYGAYAHFDGPGDLETYRIGGEATYHASRFSLAAIVGYEHGDRASVEVGVVDDSTAVDSYGRGGSLFSMADITFYPQENWSLTAGHRYVGRAHAAAFGTERAFARNGLSVFAEGRVGEAGYMAGWAGIRVRFGGSKASLQSSEQSGYINRLKDELFVPANTRQRNLVAPPPPPPPPTGGSGGCCGACYST